MSEWERVCAIEPVYTIVREGDGKRFKPRWSYSWRNVLTHTNEIISEDGEIDHVHCMLISSNSGHEYKADA